MRYLKSEIFKNYDDIVYSALKGNKDAKEVLNFAINTHGLIKEEIERLDQIIDEQIESNPHAMNIRAKLYLQGLNREKDFEKANVLLEKSINLNNFEAVALLASTYQYDKPEEIALAIKIYEKAIKQEDTRSMVSRAEMHCTGQGGKIDIDAAKKLLNKAIELGCHHAMNITANLYRSLNNYKGSIELDKRAAQLGNVNAMTNLGCVYLSGELCNYERAAFYYRLACNTCILKDQYDIFYEFLQKVMKHSQQLEVLYHHALAQKTPSSDLLKLFKNSPAEIIALLLKDEYLNDEKRFTLLENLFPITPEIINNLNTLIGDSNLEINNFGKYLLLVTDKLITDHYKEDSKNNYFNIELKLKMEKFHMAICLYRLVPETSTSYGKACHSIALQTFYHIKERTQMIDIAFACVSPILLKAIKANDEDSKDFYCMMINSLLFPDEKTSDNDFNWQSLQTAYENRPLSSETKAAIQIEKFILGYRLDEMDFWQHQVYVNIGKTIDYQNEKITVPFVIADIINVLNSKKTALEKIALLDNYLKRWKATFFSKFIGTEVTTQCYQKAFSLVEVCTEYQRKSDNSNKLSR